ncbi:MAG: hypothetical protein ACLQFW_19135 [Xanthobacteraceae bacterium]
MLRPLPTFSGAVVRKRITAHRKERARRERANATLMERQRLKKLALLFSHYRIANKKDMAALAKALAVEHVPGFKVVILQKSRAGRKLKWDPGRLEQLYRTVETVKRQRGFTDRLALKLMVNNQEHAPTWGVPPDHKGTRQQWVETLESRLQKAKSLHRLYDEAERTLEAASASVKFRK